MVSGGFLSRESAPSEEARSAFPDDLEPPPVERQHKNIFIFHDESTFNANDDESLQWGMPEFQIIRPKSRGSGIMVSDFITEKDGYLCLTEEEYTVVKMTLHLPWLLEPCLNTENHMMAIGQVQHL